MSDSEKNFALRQGHGIASEDGYFEARPQIDSMDRRKVFGAGFERGWEAALAAEPAQERIQALELEVRQLTEQIAELRHAPTPQADSQPAPLREGEWINDAGRIKWLMWRVQDLEAKLAARAPADSVLEDAALWHWLAEYLVGTRTDLDDEIVASKTVNDLRKLVKAAIKQGEKK